MVGLTAIPLSSSGKNEGVTAPYVNQLQRRFTITHPFHPLYQRQFELLSYRKSWGRQFIEFQYANGKTGAIPLAWTQCSHHELGSLMKRASLITSIMLVAAPGVFAQSDEQLIETVRSSAAEIFQ